MTQSSRYTYECGVCGGAVTKKPCIAVKEKPKEGEKRSALSGLHGWKCENGCQRKTRYATVTRDMSGGKEQDKQNRSMAWSVSRPLLVKRHLKKEEN